MALTSSLLLGACAGQAQTRRNLGVMTSLPILWAEEPSIGAMLSKAEAPPHWARGVLEARDAVVPLDRIAGDTLRGVDLAVLAQPRPLAPDEMAALDRWVRGGGKLLLFADPMLTAHSIFPVGDKRRPQAIAMIDPLLAHWGLELGFDDAAAEGEAVVRAAGLSLPVNLPGALKASGKRCTVDP
ncbi:MAG: Gldg family protein, partial [Novosphingobium sp.]